MSLYASVVSGPSKNRHALATIAVLLLTSGISRAEPPRIEAPADVEGCPSGDDLQRAIAAQLRRDELSRADAPRVVVHIRHRDVEGKALAADVTMTMADGASTFRRTVDGGDECSDLVRAAALSIALALESDASERSEKKTAAPPTAPAAPPEAREQPALPMEPARRDRVVVTASALTSVGLLPRPAAGAGVAGRARLGESVWISARGLWLPEATMPNGSFGLGLLAAGAGACVEPFGTTAVSAVGCAHVLGGAFEVTRTSADMQDDAARAYVAAALSAGARARIAGPVHLEGAVDAHVPFTRPTYLTTTCPPTGFEPAFVALALWLGAGISFR